MDETIFQAFKEQLAGGGVRAVSAPQLFATPHDLAARMVEMADIQSGHRVLEPSAGTGHILQAIGPQPEKVAVEINWQLCQTLTQKRNSGLQIIHGDFLDLAASGELGTFDRIVMNPPFENGADIKHIKAAVQLLRPDGVLVALCANGPRQNNQLSPLALNNGGDWENLPAGTFKNAGTMVNVALLRIYA